MRNRTPSTLVARWRLALHGLLMAPLFFSAGCSRFEPPGITAGDDSQVEQFIIPTKAPVLCTARILLTTSPSPSTLERGLRTASVDRVRDLFIHVEWRGLEGPHLARVEVRTPTGDLYDSLSVPFDTRGGSVRHVWWTDGPPHPVPISVNVVNGTSRTRHVLPVAGTAISQMSLKGTWRFLVFLDREEQPRASATLVFQ